MRAVSQLTFRQLGINWQLYPETGWGNLGINLSLQLLRRGIEPILMIQPSALQSLPLLYRKLVETFPIQPPNDPPDYPVFHPLANNLGYPGDAAFWGPINVGVAFTENTAFSAEELISARRYDAVLAGSVWNARILQHAGLEGVRIAYQGIDPALFHAAPRSNVFEGRFVVFSGGKLEYRKGQDIVVAAFKAFHARHPDALLLTAWHNHWPQTMEGIEKHGYVDGAPAVVDGTAQLGTWLIRNGLERASFYDLGRVARWELPILFREADVALFPSRCEGGTNLVAMECMACAIPVILSANTGHLDIIAEGCCYPLTAQKQVPVSAPWTGTAGWGESDVEEIVETLEEVYRNREKAQRTAQAGSTHMLDWSWEIQLQTYLNDLPYPPAGVPSSSLTERLLPHPIELSADWNERSAEDPDPKEEGALRLLRRANAANPHDDTVKKQLFDILVGRAGRLERRVASLSGVPAAERAPDHSAMLGRTLVELGESYLRAGRHQAAVLYLRQALEMASAVQDTVSLLLAEALLRHNRWSWGREVLPHVKGRENEIANLRAWSFHTENRFLESYQHFREALEAGLEDGQLLAGAASSAAHLGLTSEAMRFAERHVEIHPDCSEARFHLSFQLLAAGRYSQGWKDYEIRRANNEGDFVIARRLSVPEWDGQEIGNHGLLLLDEQGIGDIIFFSRFVPMARKKCGRVVLAVPTHLVRLFADLPGVDAVIDRDLVDHQDLLRVHNHAFLGSLPHLLGLSDVDLPGCVPYLTAPSTDVRRFRRILESVSDPKVGIAWTGNPEHAGNVHRSCPIEVMAEGLKDLAGVKFVNLHISADPFELRWLKGNLDCVDFKEHIEDLADTAALIENLDLVISVDTSAAHLAGAMGKTVWTLLPYGAEWRWQQEKRTSSWYPTMQLFRQRSHGDWRGLLKEVRSNLKRFLESRTAAVAEG